MALSRYLKGIVNFLHSRGFNSVRISKHLKERYGYRITSRGVRNLVNPNNNLQKRSRCSKVDQIHFDYINFSYQKNKNATASDIQTKILDIFNVFLSVSTIKNIRKQLGWTSAKTKYCQLISNKNKVFRKKWCLTMLKEEADFQDLIFTDESTVELSSTGILTFYCRNSGFDSKPYKEAKPKHSFKVHVWGGISYRGRTNICIFSGIMDSLTYQTILKENLLPFVEKKFPDGYLLYQDNDSKHKSKSTTEWMRENNVTTITAPASSPDINPIENVWASMKDFLKRKEKPKTKDALIAGIVKFWETLTPQACGRYIDHLHKVLPEVVLNEGGPTEIIIYSELAIIHFIVFQTNRNIVL